MKKGNFRTKKIYPNKGETKYVIEARANGIWKILGSGNKQLIFDNEEDAVNSLISISQFVKYFGVKTNANGIDENVLKNGTKKNNTGRV